jgi:hypothetical protein
MAERLGKVLFLRISYNEPFLPNERTQGAISAENLIQLSFRSPLHYR